MWSSRCTSGSECTRPLERSRKPHARGYSQVADTFDEAPPVTCSESPRLGSGKRVIVGPASTAFPQTKGRPFVVLLSWIDESRLPTGANAIDEEIFPPINNQ